MNIFEPPILILSEKKNILQDYYMLFEIIEIIYLIEVFNEIDSYQLITLS